ncbi:hypothetical protein ACOME3_008783 [Neoechinorhynchus agilis]
MLTVMKLERDISIHPENLGPELEQAIRESVIEDCEGASMGSKGICVAIGKIISIGLGRVVSWTPYVQFSIRFEAIMFRPLRNEIADAVIVNITKFGIFSSIGAIQCFISMNTLSKDYGFVEDIDLGPVIRNAHRVFAINDVIRLRVQGYRAQGLEFFAVGVLVDEERSAQNRI